MMRSLPHLPDKLAPKFWLLLMIHIFSEESVFPGPNPSVYAFMKVTTQRNIYRVPVP